ncbi:hypothetical protein OPQ81_010623 [Rhizoctonia solani]|nr:hypothetical protein OPQ81_010623 [Rhizoctonia solani]
MDRVTTDKIANYDPSGSRAESPVDTSSEGQVSTGIVTSTEYQATSLAGIETSPTKAIHKDADDGIPRKSSTSEVTMDPPLLIATSINLPHLDLTSGSGHSFSSALIPSITWPQPLQPTVITPPNSLRSIPFSE